MTEAAAPVTTEQSTTEAPAEGSAPAQAAQEPKKFKVNVYGQEREVDEATLLREFQKSLAADEKFRKAAEIEKQSRALMEELEKDPWSPFKKKGLDPYQEAENLLIKKLQYEQMTPSEKRAHDLELRNQEIELKLKMKEAETQAEKEKLAQEYQEQLTSQAVQEIDHEIVEALKATGVKPTPRVIARMAEVMIAHLEARDGKRLEASKAFEMTREETFAEMAELLPQLSSEEILKLPKPVLDTIRKALLNQASSQNPVRSTPSKGRSEATKRRPTLMSTDAFFNNLEKKFK